MKKTFQSPKVHIFKVAPTDLVHTSTGISGKFSLNGWNNMDAGAWDESLPTNGSGLGGWTNNGGSAWE